MRIVHLPLSNPKRDTAISFSESGSITRTEWSVREAAIYFLTDTEQGKQVPILPI